MSIPHCLNCSKARIIKFPRSSPIDAVKIILERTPPEISSDIYKSGVYLTGGSSRIKDLGRFVYDQLGLKVNLCEEPESTVVMGLGAIIEDPHLAKLTL